MIAMRERMHLRIRVIAVAALVIGCGGSSGTTPTEHRPSTPAACTARPPAFCPAGSTGECARDADCTAGFNGRCLGATGNSCACGYDACRTDADCPTGTACACDAGYGGNAFPGPTQCLPSGCRLDSDCASGYCSPSRVPGAPGGCGAARYGYYCHTPNDACGNDSDCGGLGNACIYSPELHHWTCVTFSVCAG